MHLLVPGDELPDVLAPYADVDRSGRDPWVLANMVGSLDGSATIDGRVGALSQRPDAALFRLMRAVADVVVVGAETVRREGYGSVRLAEDRRAARVAAGRTAVPTLAVVTRSLDLDWTLPAFVEADAASPTLVITCSDADPARLEIARQHAPVVIAGAAAVDLALAMTSLAGLGHHIVLCEGGPSLLGQLVALGLLDELCLTLAPLMGADALPISITPPDAEITPFRLAHTAADGDTLFLRYERSSPWTPTHSPR
ncbi:MAG: pyrimidine reductase family protein [Acidimicrobiales bacterium]